MSISFILRMISGAISNKDDKTTPRISINKEIDRARKRAAKRLNRAKLRAQEEMGEADRVRITIMSGDMKKFTNEFTQIKNVNFQDCAYLSGLERFVKERRNWRELQELSDKAMGLMTLSRAMDAIGFGAGVLDQYAQLPHIKKIGTKCEDKTKALTEMSERLQIFGQEVKKICKHLQELRREARRVEDALLDLNDYLEDGIVDIHRIRGKSGNDWVKYTESEKILIGRTVQIAHLISVLSEVRFMTDEAELRPEISNALEEAEELLDELGA